MTTERKRAANRRNALRSTGPRTPAGKARTARNPITHGLLSREVLLPGEDREEFEAFAASLRRDLEPEGTYEELLVDSMIKAVWKLRRLGRMEGDILSWKPAQNPIANIVIYDAADPQEQAVFYLPDNHRGPERESNDAEQVRADAERATLPIGLAFLQGCGSGTDAFGRLSRYEASIEKSLYRASHELERRQRTRRGGHVPPPLAVDVTVSGRVGGGPDGSGSAPRLLDKAEPKGGAENEGHGPAKEVTENAIEDEIFQ